MKRDANHLRIEEILRAVSYFSQLDDPELILVAQTAICHGYDAGQIILLEGEPCVGLYIVESGWLKAIKIGLDGREQVLQTLSAGDVFNAISVFTDAPNQATVTALETSASGLSVASLLKMLDEHPSLARQVVKDLAGRVMHLIRMVEDLSLRTVEVRLARFLLEQAEGEAVRRRRWATQAEMAARLGTVPDVVNRALRKLVEEGLIQVERRQIHILDLDRLRNIAQVIDP
jgi:CRP/FNR family transcriptional regulator